MAYGRQAMQQEPGGWGTPGIEQQPAPTNPDKKQTYSLHFFE